MDHHVFNEYLHITSFEIRFPDGKTKPAFLWTSVSKIVGHQVMPYRFKALGLREDIDYATFNLTELPQDVLPSRRIAQHPMKGGRRTVVSATGLTLLVTSNRKGIELSDKVRYWVIDEVVPAVIRDGSYCGTPSDEVLDELREQREREQMTGRYQRHWRYAQ